MVYTYLLAQSNRMITMIVLPYKATWDKLQFKT